MKKLLLSTLIAVCGLAFITSCGKGDDPIPEVKYTVTFDSQGGSNVASAEVVAGSLVAKPTNPTKSESTFAGWFKEAAGTNQWNFASDKVNANITLYAKWIEGTVFTVTFNTNGGLPVPTEQVVAEGGKATRPATNPAKDLHTFDNWYADEDLESVYNFETAVTKNITIYAKWTIQSDKAQLIRDLEAQVTRAEAIVEDQYTESSFSNMAGKLSNATNLLEDSETATEEDLFEAYMELKLAIDNLVKKGDDAPNKTASIKIYNPGEIDGTVYAVIGKYISIDVECFDANGSYNGADVEFTYPGLDAWVTSSDDIYAGNYSIYFTVKEGVAANQTVTLTITPKDNAAAKKTTTLKTIAYSDIKAMFIAAVNDLPATASYNDIAKYEKASTLSYYIDYEDDLKTVLEKFESYEESFRDLPTVVKYTSVGNKYTLKVMYGEIVEQTMVTVYEAQGAFPAGSYTSEVWEYWDSTYEQFRIVLKADGTITSEYRESYNADGSNPTAWQTEVTGTYTHEGNASSGTMYVKFEDEDDDDPTPAPQPDEKSKTGFFRMR